MEDSTSLIKTVELSGGGRQLTDFGDIMNGLDNWLTEPKERDVVEIEDVLDTSFIEMEDEEIRSPISTESNKGGENMECGGKITNGICDCHVYNCCSAVNGESKVNPECPHKEWVMGYKFFYIRVMNQIAKEDYFANGV